MFSPLSSDQELRTEALFIQSTFVGLPSTLSLTAQAGVNWFQRTREGLVNGQD